MEGGSFVDGRGGATLGRMSEGDEWWEKGEWRELREKGEGGVFEKGEREAWREKSVMVALRGRGERGELALKLEKRMVDGKRTFIAKWGFKSFRSEMRFNTILDGCNKGKFREWREETL